MRKTASLAALLSVLVFAIVISSCVSLKESDCVTSGISELIIPKEGLTVELEVGGRSENSFITVRGSNRFTPDDIEFISGDVGIASVSYDVTKQTSLVYYSVEGISVGETFIYFRVKDSGIESKKIKVTVTSGVTAPLRTVIPEPTPTSPVTTADPTHADSMTVYITPSGKKYHLSPSCAGKNAAETTFGKVKDSLEPCSKCAG